MIDLQAISQIFGNRILFDNVSMSLTASQRYGLVGPNGYGKTTFLKIIAQQEKPSSGTIKIPKTAQIGSLGQDHYSYDDQPINETVFSGRTKLWKIYQARKQLQEKTDFSQEDGIALAELENAFLHEGGFQAWSEISSLLIGLGIEEEIHNQTMAVLSGGFRLRILLARLLFSSPDILLLDEPTNHLDIVSSTWLEKFLISQPWTVIVASHNRGFLNTVCTTVLHFAQETITSFPGNYDHFVAEESRIKESHKIGMARQQDKKAQLEKFVSRFQAGTRANQAREKARELAKMEILVAKPEPIPPRIQIPLEHQSGKDAINIEDLCFGYEEDKPLFTDLSFRVNRNDRLAIIGMNGRGKTTLMRLLSEKETPQKGSIRFGSKVMVATFDQNNRDLLPPDRTPFSWLCEKFPQEAISTVYRVLGLMRLGKDLSNSQIHVLSGGECTRLVLASIHLQKPNILFLDEPTNHLDIQTIGALAEGLNDYKGTVVFVSHDRAFVASVANRLLLLGQKGVLDFNGTYDQWTSSPHGHWLDLPDPNANNEIKPKKDKKGKKKHDKKLNAKKTIMKNLEKKIETSEEKIKEIQTKFTELAQENNSDKNVWKELQEEQKKCETQIESYTEEWNSHYNSIEKEADPQGETKDDKK